MKSRLSSTDNWGLIMSKYSDCYAKTWTEDARNCYERGCLCKGCYMFEILGYQCQMKLAVFKLVKEIGAPPSKDKWLTPKQQAVIYAILAGDNTREEIEARTGFPRRVIQYLLQDLYEIAETDNFITNKKQDSLPKFAKWVRGEGYYD